MKTGVEWVIDDTADRIPDMDMNDPNIPVRDKNKYASDCEIAYAIILEMLGEKPMLAVEKHYEHRGATKRQKSRRTMRSLDIKYNSDKSLAVTEINQEFHELVPAKTFEDAEKLVHKMQSLLSRLKKAGGNKSTDDAREIVFQMLADPLFTSTIEKIHSKKKWDILRISEFIEERYRLHRSASAQSVLHKRLRQPEPEYTSQGRIIAPATIMAMTTQLRDDDKDRCFNCRFLGHFAMVCKTPICNVCQLHFTSLKDPNYHHWSQCPQNHVQSLSYKGMNKVGREASQEQIEGRGAGRVV